MLSFVQSWFTAGANPIGVDFGTECLRMAQVERTATDCRLIAAASMAVPATIRHEPAARNQFFSEQLHRLWASGNFRGRRVVLALPAASMYVEHMRLPRMDDESIKKALPWESQGKLPIDSATAILRHLTAGDVYASQEPRSEVILLAAERKLVDGLLASAAKARLDVAGINVEPLAMIDCFQHIYRRKSDADVTNCFVDIGAGASRAIVARGGHIFFVRNLPVGGEHFNRAVAGDFNISTEEARALRAGFAAPVETAPRIAEIEEPARLRANQRAVPRASDSCEKFWAEALSADRRKSLAAEDGSLDLAPGRGGFDAESQAGAVATATRATADRARVERAIQNPLAKLTEELSLCRRYHEATFPDRAIEKLIFVGGEARQRELCQQVAQKLGIAAQVGDPLVRMGRTTEVGIESGIDRRQPQPAWAVAIGLSMGPLGGSTP